MTYNPETFPGQTIGALTDAGVLQDTDTDVIDRGGASFKTSLATKTAMFRRSPAGSRTAALPAVLTEADHDKNIILTGSSGSLSVDGTLLEGFRCHIINNASGLATYSGIVGLLSTNALASGAVCTVMKAGQTVYASAISSVAVGAATAYTTTLSTASGAVGASVTVTFTPNGAWPNSEAISLVLTGLSGTWGNATGGSLSGSTLSPVAGSAAASASFVPSTAATGSINSTSSPALTNSSGAQTYTATSGGSLGPGLTTSGAARLLVIQGDAGVTPASGSAGTAITAIADQSGGLASLSIPVAGGLVLGGAVNLKNTLAGSSANWTSNQGVRSASSPSWLTTMTGGPFVTVVSFRTGTTLPTQREALFSFQITPYSYNKDLELTVDVNGILYTKRSNGSGPGADQVSLLTGSGWAAGTNYHVVIRDSQTSNVDTAASAPLDWWINSTTKTGNQAGGSSSYSNTGASATSLYTTFALGATASSSDLGGGNTPNYGITTIRIMEFQAIKGLLSDTDCQAFFTYLQGKWGS